MGVYLMEYVDDLDLGVEIWEFAMDFSPKSTEVRLVCECSFVFVAMVLSLLAWQHIIHVRTIVQWMKQNCAIALYIEDSST
jgi:hypothetical protein